jgi:hypothetical protein
MLHMHIKKCSTAAPGLVSTYVWDKIMSVKLPHNLLAEKLLQGPMLGFLKYFRQKNSAKTLAFFTQNKAKLCKNLIITLVFEKKR